MYLSATPDMDNDILTYNLTSISKQQLHSGFPAGPEFPMQGAQLPPLAGDLRSHMCHAMTKKKPQKTKKFTLKNNFIFVVNKWI